MKRDLLAWLVDIATVVVGGSAVGALIFTAVALSRDERRYTQAWQRQIALDHHARIYEAAAEVLWSFTVFARSAEARVQAHGTAVVDYGYSEDSDETVDLKYRELLDSFGGPISGVHAAHDEAKVALDRLWFLIPREGAGEVLLLDLRLLDIVLDAVRPSMTWRPGMADLNELVRASNLEAAIQQLVSTDDLGPDHPMKRLTFTRLLATRYLRARIARFVPPPPLASIEPPSAKG